MKKLIALVLMLALSLSLCACGKKVSGAFELEGDETLDPATIIEAVESDIEAQAEAE